MLLAALVSSYLVGSTAAPAAAAGPPLTVTVLVDGLIHPWDLAFTPDGTMLFTERPGRLRALFPDGTVRLLAADMGDLFVGGESGLMGLAVDPAFAQNRRIYTCQAVAGGGVQVLSWGVDAQYMAANRIADPLVSGLARANNGRHGGCRLRFGPGGFLFIATGDGASGTNPQDLESLGGKVLRVDPETGDGAPGNPFAGPTSSADRSRIYTYGHRNVQGLALRPGTGQLWAVEHGPTRDDEVNLLQAGGNYGWDPVPGYNESVPMTDLAKFPDAVPARWSSGASTLATSGAVFLEGDHWGEWEGALAVATLKNRTLRIMRFSPAGALQSVDTPPELDGAFGRLRTPIMGPDGALYVTTSNGSDDKILRVAAPEPAPSPGQARPFGAFDRALGDLASITVSGWAADPDTTAPIAVHVYVDGALAAATLAQRSRPDVGNRFPAVGAAHGFRIELDSPPGLHRACVFAINDGPGPNASIGCRDVVVGRSAAARSVTTGYTEPESATLTATASTFGMTPAVFQKTGVYVAAFLTRLGGAPGPRPLLPPPSTDGQTAFTTAWTADEVAVLNFVSVYFDIDEAAAQKLGATLLVFLANL